MKIHLLLFVFLSFSSCIVIKIMSHEGSDDGRLGEQIMTVQPYQLSPNDAEGKETVIQMTLPDKYLGLDTIKLMNDLIILKNDLIVGDDPLDPLIHHREGFLTSLDTFHIFNPKDYTETIKIMERQIPVIVNYLPDEK